jgi:MFS family permease
MKVKGNLWRFYFYTIFSFTPFSLPILVLFWKENGLDLFQIFLLQSLFAVAVVLLEVPTGMIADRIGKRTSLIYGAFFLFIGCFIYSLGSSFLAFLLAEVILSLGVCLLSGADSSLLYDTLKSLDRESEYTKVESRARAYQMVAFAMCNLVGGFIGSYSYRLTMYISVIGPLLAFIVSFGFVEVNKGHLISSFKEGLESYKGLISESFKFMKKHKLIRWIIVFSAVISCSSTWLLWLYQPYMEYVKLPVWTFGMVFALFNFFAAFASNISPRLERKFGQQGMILFLMACQTLTLVFMGLLVTPVSFLFILGHQAVRGLSRPLINQWVLKYTFEDKRSTILSFCSLGGRLFYAFTSPILGYIAGLISLEMFLLLQGVILTIIFLIMIVSYKKIPEKYFIPKKSLQLG